MSKAVDDTSAVSPGEDEQGRKHKSCKLPSIQPT